MPTTSSLDEVVVVGHGIQTKRALTGTIASVDSETILQNINADPVASLQRTTADYDPATSAVMFSDFTISQLLSEKHRAKMSLNEELGNNYRTLERKLPLAHDTRKS